MVDNIVGVSGEPFTVLVEAGKIREFALATRSDDPAYVDVDGGTPIAEPTFLMTARLWQLPDSLPKIPPGSGAALHGEQEFVFHGEPPAAGTRLTAQIRVAAAYEKEGKRGGTLSFKELVTEFHDESGRLVAESKMTTVETSRVPSAESGS